mmetsp:Transcript_80476/g.145282  ORF Transcript_80476/g.145282 Transcript_80476/m.145282 type:complete len:1314 (+) Transcript_80476:255-4196(+)
MAGQSVPELPPLNSLTRCPSLQASQGVLPRFAAPPLHHLGVPHHSPEQRGSMGGPGGGSSSSTTGMRGTPTRAQQHELPAVRESPMAPSRSSPVPKPSVSRRAASSELDFHFGAGGANTFNEIESLKRHIAKLTQLRRDRDSYIEDLLADADAAQRRHEGELARKTARTQREVGERMAAQQREHDFHLDERSRAHASALAQQAWQGELELGELRKTLRAEGERRLASKSAEYAHQHRQSFLNLERGLEALMHLLRGHASSLESALPGHVGLSSKASALTTDLSQGNAEGGCNAIMPNLLLQSCSWDGKLPSLEPEPEEGHGSVVSEDCEKSASELAAGGNSGADQLEQVLADQALADQLAAHAAKSAELALSSASACLERAAAAGLRLISVMSQSGAAGDSGCRGIADSFFDDAAKQQESSPRLKGTAWTDSTADSDCTECSATLSKEEIASPSAAVKSFRAQLRNCGVAFAQIHGSGHLGYAFLTWRAEVRQSQEKQHRWQIFEALSTIQEHRQQAALLRAWAASTADARREQMVEESLAQAKAKMNSVRAYLVRQVEASAAQEVRQEATLVLSRWSGEAHLVQQARKHREALLEAEAATEADRQLLAAEADRQQNSVALSLRSARRAQGLGAVEAHAERVRHVAFRSWAAMASKSVLESTNLRQLEEAAAASRAETAELVESRRRETMALCSKLQKSGLSNVEAELVRSQHLVFRAWAAEAAAARQEQLHKAELVRGAAQFRSTLEGHSARGKVLSGAYLQQLALCCWAFVAASSKRDSSYERRLESLTTESAAERAALKEEGRRRTAVESRRSRQLAHRVVRGLMLRQMAAGLHGWAVAVREGKREAQHRHRLLAASADSSAELYRFRSEAKRVAVDLRKQRRAHGVAAVHSSLDRRLQGFLHAWSMIARDAQREVMYQRQLDIAAAEAAATCAVLRMEGRRNALELKHQKRKQALRAVASMVRHWRHAVLYAWSVVVAEARHDEVCLQQLGAAAAQAAASAADARRRVAQVQRNQQALGERVISSRQWHVAQVLLSAWRGDAAAARKAACDLRQSTELRALSLRWGMSVRGAEVLLPSLLSAWQLLSAGGRKRDVQLREAMTTECESREQRLRSEFQAELSKAVAAEARQGAMLLEDLEARHRSAALTQAAELEAKHAGMVRQHTEATRSLLAETEARHADALRAEASTSGAQLTLLRGEHAVELRKQESLSSMHATQAKLQADLARSQLLEAEARHEETLQAENQQTEARYAAELHGLTSSAEVQLSKVEAQHAAALRAQAEEANVRQAELLRLAEQHLSSAMRSGEA